MEANQPVKRLSASMEDYIEAIWQLVAEKQAARAKDIAVRLGVTRASVTGALRALAREGWVNHAPYDVITLTEAGRTEAAEIIRRHEALKEFFVSLLGVEAGEAERAACGMEHAVSGNIVDRLVAFVADWKAAAQRRKSKTRQAKKGR